MKTQLSTADQRLIIASEAQLDTAGSRLLLCHQGIAATPASGGASRSTLWSTIAYAPFADAGPSVLDAFEVALEAWGYDRKDEYDQPAWLLTDRRLFEVREDFPRITPAMLPAGVQKVSYEILLRACEPFAVDLDEHMDGVFA